MFHKVEGASSSRFLSESRVDIKAGRGCKKLFQAHAQLFCLPLPGWCVTKFACRTDWRKKQAGQGMNS